MRVQLTSPMRTALMRAFCTPEVGGCKAQGGQYPGSSRPSQGQGRPLLANVCQLNIVHYDEVIEMAHQGRDLVEAVSSKRSPARR